ncbi:MAG: radical SAM protein, partial [Bacteroidetes bacterium]|nr:radical SAM protein [Bacteroidota bacterium]
YLYPQRITPGLLETMAELPQICRYVDIPLQHTHPAVLQRMRRPKDDIARLVDSIRQAIPDVAIRTTFIVGFPGETAAEHNHLLRSIEALRLDHVGVFAYSPQEGTPAASMPNQVPEHTKERRRREAMEVAQKVSLRQNKKLVGRELDVLVEGVESVEGNGREPMMAGRSYRDAPEVDGLVLFRGHAALGQIVRVRVTGALEYDLIGDSVTG